MVKKPSPRRDSNHRPRYPQATALTTALRITYLFYAETDFILATSFTSEQKRSLKNEKQKREKVTREVKECSRRKAQNCQAKNLHKETP